MDSTPPAAEASTTPLKRKRSPSAASSTANTAAGSAPSAKAAKTSPQLSINYLARQSAEDLPLINKDESLPALLQLLLAYSNILDRHESLASNLGARPLGPILIKRFERCFDAPPKVVASHHKTTTTGSSEETAHNTITWLDVIEFARSHPSRFTLSTFSEGQRVCQFYYPQKQLRVQISEEDFLFINSGRCQELIPPLPIWEDEEKEVATCDVLESRLKELTNAADMVAARTRQLSHRLKGRRTAILERRAEGGSGTPAKASALHTTTAPPSATGSGFVAVNAGHGRSTSEAVEFGPSSFAAVRNDLLRHFESLPHNQGTVRTHSSHLSVNDPPEPVQWGGKSGDSSNVYTEVPTGGPASVASSVSPAPATTLPFENLPYPTPENSISARGHSVQHSMSYAHHPSTTVGSHTNTTTVQTTLKHNFSRPLPPALESGQPFRPLCQSHMDSLPRGHRVLPPCDRCRRLRMDCVKNLTSCAGCTRKHARCHWRDVSRDELGALDHVMDSTVSEMSPPPTDANLSNGYLAPGDDDMNNESEDEDSNPLEDLEALGEKEERMKEEEENLRNAREIARHDWEESLRSVQHSHLLEAQPDTVVIEQQAYHHLHLRHHQSSSTVDHSEGGEGAAAAGERHTSAGSANTKIPSYTKMFSLEAQNYAAESVIQQQEHQQTNYDPVHHYPYHERPNSSPSQAEHQRHHSRIVEEELSPDQESPPPRPPSAEMTTTTTTTAVHQGGFRAVNDSGNVDNEDDIHVSMMKKTTGWRGI